MKLLRIFVLFFFFVFLFTPNTYAQVGSDISCSSTSSEEFHSLRPYQANSSCQIEQGEFASFCGNTLTLQDKVSIEYSRTKDSCTELTGGKVRCSYFIPNVTRAVEINLSEADFPIMGNTEDEISDAEKVNEYVSWYLSGIPNRKEYPKAGGDDNLLLNYSGPVAKLLPQEIQLAQRIKTIERAVGKDVNEDDIEPRQDRHDQIVVCTKGVDIPLVGITVGSSEPTDCDELFSIDEKRRLNWWDGNLSEINSIVASVYEAWGGITGFFADVFNSYSLGQISQYLEEVAPWEKRVPPLSWEFENPILYKKAYNEWRGKSCIYIPFPVKTLFCVENILIPNKWANLFGYVPLSSTEDLEGSFKIDSASSGSAGVTNISFSNQNPSTLFFSHVQEVDELGSLLQDTYLASGEEKTGSNVAVEPPSSCKTVDVRSNQGDSLFASSITGNLRYDASFTCDFDPLKTTSQTCSKNILVSLSTSSNTPKINDVWSRLVGGPASIVKRLFPKLGSQIGTLKDIPGSTAVTYSGDAQGSGSLNLPHLGGISEYFLKGIQTLLRPKGFGETISFGETAKEKSGNVCATADEYNIPCCQLEGVIEVETANNPIFIGSDTCKRGGQTFSCCNGNYCGPANIACNQYTAWDGGDGLDLCDYEDSAELLARAMLFKMCQADGRCVSGWASEGDYILENYSIEDGDYTASAYFYGLARGCTLTACSQFRWGNGKGYCDAVKYYCDNGTAFISSPDVSFCEQCNEEEMIPAGMPINCSAYR